MTPHEALTRALADLADSGRQPPCAADTERWTGDDPTTHEGAAVACRHCPIRAACDGAAADATWGVWAGRCMCSHSDRTATRREIA